MKSSYLTVNQALDAKSEINNAGVEIEGILGIEPEGFHLLHYPKVDRREPIYRGDARFNCGIWLAFGDGSIRPNHQKLSQWEGKRVRVHGIFSLNLFKRHDGEIEEAGSGPWGMWVAHIEPFSIQRVTSEQRHEAGT